MSDTRSYYSTESGDYSSSSGGRGRSQSRHLSPIRHISTPPRPNGSTVSPGNSLRDVGQIPTPISPAAIQGVNSTNTAIMLESVAHDSSTSLNGRPGIVNQLLDMTTPIGPCLPTTSTPTLSAAPVHTPSTVLPSSPPQTRHMPLGPAVDGNIANGTRSENQHAPRNPSPHNAAQNPDPGYDSSSSSSSSESRASDRRRPDSPDPWRQEESNSEGEHQNEDEDGDDFGRMSDEEAMEIMDEIQAAMAEEYERKGGKDH
ncbi:hypothetical protein BJ508DRAFT_337064, partial [Ascobolus immersus RN42]